jgi:hypothetical protein
MGPKPSTFNSIESERERVILEKCLKDEQVLRVRAQAVRDGEAGVERTEVSGWLPPHPGQTAGQKPQEITQGRATTVRQHEAEHNVQPAKVEG